MKKKVAFLLTAILCLMLSASATVEADTSERFCNTFTRTGYVVSELDCYYQFDVGGTIYLVPNSGVSISVGQCYKITYYLCSPRCGDGAITSAQASFCP